MRGFILGTGLLISCLATGLAGPVALAADATTTTEPYLSASGSPLSPGQEVHVQGYCPDPAAGPLTSDVLTDVRLLHDATAAAPNLNGSGVVAAGTAPGTYTATMACNGESLTAPFTVVADQTGQPPAGTWLAVEPKSAHPGDTVTATAAGCAAPGVLTSPVLGTVTLAQNPEGHQPWAMSGTTTVNSDAEPGRYPVSVDCGEQRIKATFTVLPAPTQGGPATHPSTPSAAPGAGQVSRVPKGAPATGGGAPEHSTLPLTAGLALGAAVAAAGAGALARRRVRS
ncbi:MAG TPA: hypothetical protein VGI84_11470 [Pseudonocardiaceae bacterium]|jgi:hypothetical protein